MSIQENAAQLGQMGQDETAQGMIGSATGHLSDAVAALAGAVQHVTQVASQAAALLGGPEGDHIAGQGQQVVEELNNLIGQIEAAKSSAEAGVGFANAFNTALRDAAQRHGGAS